MLTVSPVSYNGGAVWSVMTGIHGALQAIGYGLLVLFFAAGVVKTCGSFAEVRRPEQALKLFVRFALAKAAVDFSMDLILAVFDIVQGMISQVIGTAGASGIGTATLPQELVDTINACGFWESIPLWAVTLIGSLLITVLSFVMVLTVYGRMFSLWMYAAIAPVPLSAFAGEPTSSVGKSQRHHGGVVLCGRTGFQSAGAGGGGQGMRQDRQGDHGAVKNQEPAKASSRFHFWCWMIHCKSSAALAWLAATAKIMSMSSCCV